MPAGDRADRGGTLEEVYAAANKTNDNTRSMGVALSSCTIPASDKPIFQLGDDEIEIGLGIHGEPGQMRGKWIPADSITDQLVARVLEDLPFRSGDEVALLVNGLGATPLAELYIVFRRVAQLLQAAFLLAVIGSAGMLSDAFVVPLIGRMYDVWGAQAALRTVAILPCIVTFIFAGIWMRDRARGSYQPVLLHRDAPTVV